MPPWLPDDQGPALAEDRRLSASEETVLLRWLKGTQPEGEAADLPPAPVWPTGWTLGEPDWVVTLPTPYTLVAEGRDLYQNFVMPINLPTNRFVRGVEFRPGNRRVVHHAFIYLDPTSESRRLAASSKSGAIPGMTASTSARMPEGQFLSFQPGKTPHFPTDGTQWLLRTNTDLVLQVHLNPSGKPEPVQPSVGFFFSDKPASRPPSKIVLTTLNLDIPPGEARFVVEDSFELPVSVELTAVLPHAHSIAREITGDAVLPDGTTRSLLHIPRWDFRWQGDYTYAQPVALPAGARLRMRFVYDNSTNNLANPNLPPKPIHYGPQSTDEMAELWFQLRTESTEASRRLQEAYARKTQRVFLEWSEAQLSRDPTNVEARMTLASLLTDQRQYAAALDHLQTVVKQAPQNAEPRYLAGVIYLQLNRLAQARSAFSEAARLKPDDFRAVGNLGVVYLRLGNTAQAAAQFRRALALNPDDAFARENLTLIESPSNAEASPQK